MRSVTVSVSAAVGLLCAVYAYSRVYVYTDGGMHKIKNSIRFLATKRYYAVKSIVNTDIFTFQDIKNHIKIQCFGAKMVPEFLVAI